jgi:hypothetical protein
MTDLSPLTYGAAGDGVTDDKGPLQAALNAAAQLAVDLNGPFITVDLGGKTYAITATVNMTGSKVILVNGKLKAIGTWSTDSPLLKIGKNSPLARYNVVREVSFDCAHMCSGIYLEDTSQCLIDDCLIYGFESFGVKSREHGTETTLRRVKAHQYWYGEADINNPLVAAGTAFDITSNDMMIQECVGNYCATGLYAGGGGLLVTACHFYCNTYSVNSVGGSVLLTGCYIDTSPVRVSNMKTTITGCLFYTGSEKPTAVDLVADSSDETGDGLCIVGNHFSDGWTDYFTFSSGTGSWSTVTLDAVIRSNACRSTTKVVPNYGKELSGHTDRLTYHFGIQPAWQRHGRNANGASMGLTRWSADNGPAGLNLSKSRSAAPGTFAAVQLNDTLGRITLSGDNGLALNTGGATIQGVTAETWTSTANGTLLTFGTTSIGASAITERLVVEADGHTRPFATDTYSSGTSDYRWSVIYAQTGIIGLSDQREKTDIKDSVLGLDFINALRPVSYRWKVGHNEMTTREVAPAVFDENNNLVSEARYENVVTPVPGVRTHYGLLAQEIKAAIDACGCGDFAGWVLDDPNDPDSRQSLRYEQFIAPLIQAVRELSAQVTALQAANSVQRSFCMKACDPRGK